MKLLDKITKEEKKRTLKLLHKTKNYLGIDGYILMKKILTVSILTDYFQKQKNYIGWVTYHRVLDRNEMAVKGKYNVEQIKKINGLNPNKGFFGIDGHLVTTTHNFNEIENEIIKYWIEQNEDDDPFL